MAGVYGWSVWLSIWLECMAGVYGWSVWLECMVEYKDENMAAVHGLGSQVGR